MTQNPNPYTQVAKSKDDPLAEIYCIAALGWRVFPVYGVNATGICSCRKRERCSATGKHPHIKQWQQHATRDTDQIRRWATKWPDCNWGLLTGADSGVIVLDVDPRNGGDDSLEQIENEHGRVPDTVESITGGGGRHFVFRHPGRRVKCGTIAPGLDRKGDGGYVVIPPSRHASTRRYHWELLSLPESTQLAQPPNWMLEGGHVTERTEKTEEYREDRSNCSALSVHSAHSVLSVSEAAIRATLPTTEGQRNRCIFDLARRLKAIPELKDAMPAVLRPAVRRWHELALPVIGTEPFDDTWGDFGYGWERVQVPYGEGVMETALAAADDATAPPAASRYEAPETVRLIKLCHELSNDGGIFFLSCRTAGELLQIDRNLALKRLNMLVRDGILEVVEQHTATKARRYRFLGG